MCSYIIIISYIDLCEWVNDDAFVSEDDYRNYESDQSYDSNQSVDNSGEEHWDTDVEEILKDLEKYDDDDLHSESSLVCGLNLILLFLSLWASFCGVSATALNHLIGFLHYVFSTMVTNSVERIAYVFPSSLYIHTWFISILVIKFISLKSMLFVSSVGLFIAIKTVLKPFVSSNIMS